MPAVGQQAKLVQQTVVVKHLAKVLLRAGVQHRTRSPQTVADLERALGETQRRVAQPRPLVIVQKHHQHAPPPKVQRRGTIQRPGPHNQRGMT